VHFSGLDADPASGTRYAASIPADIALRPHRDVLLAWALNGAPIPADHGGPLRVDVPGVTGARQVKWLARIDAASDESPSMWQQLDYRIIGPNETAETVDFSAVPSMQDMAVNSAICDPPLVVPPPTLQGSPPAAATAAPRAHLVREADGTARVRGWAWSGGGRAISRVDVSADGGASWMTADIDARPADPSPSRTRSWGWTLWSAYVPLPPRQADVTLVAKATDVAGNSQPESALSIYNFRGLGNNSWHRVRAIVESSK
jgi:sulfite oxidase